MSSLIREDDALCDNSTCQNPATSKKLIATTSDISFLLLVSAIFFGSPCINMAIRFPDEVAPVLVDVVAKLATNLIKCS